MTTLIDERRHLPGLIGALALANLTAYGRDAIVAGAFGAGARTDAYFVGAFLPTLLTTILVLESLVPAILPLFARIVSERQESRALLGRTQARALAVLACVVIVIWASAAPIVRLLAHGWDAGQVDTAASLLRITSWSLLPLGASAVIGAMLSAHRRYLSPPIGLAVSNVAVVLATVLLGGRLGIYAPAWGVVAGSMMCLALQLFAIRDFLIPPKVPVNAYRRSDAPRPTPRSSRLMAHSSSLHATILPLLLFSCLAQNVAVMERWLASSLPAGQISYLVYAGKLMMSPLLVITAASGLIAFVSMSHARAAGDVAAFRAALHRSARMLTLLLAMATVALVVLAHPIVQIALQHGRFTEHDAAVTTTLLSIYSLGLVPNGLSWLLYRSLQARAGFWDAVAVMGATTCVYVAVASILFQHSGIRGVAAAFPISQTASLVVLYVLQPARLRSPIRSIAQFGSVVFLLSAGAATGLWLVHELALIVARDTMTQATFSLLGGAVVILGAFHVGTRLVRLPEAEVLLDWLATATRRPARWLAAARG